MAEHKAIFFRSASAKYDEAIPGSLRFVPPPFRRKELDDDYAKMREMFFSAPPTLYDILAALAEIECQVNEKHYSLPEEG